MAGDTANSFPLKQTYEVLFNSIDEGMAISEMIYDDHGNIVDIIYRQTNRTFEHIGGVRDVVGRSIFDVLPNVEEHWLELFRNVARTGEPIRKENHQQDVDRWFDVYFARADEAGRYVVTVFKDITVRKRAEEALREREERQGYLLKLGDILQRLTAPSAMKSAAMDMLGKHLGVSRAQYHEVDRSGEFYSADGIGYANGLPLLDLKYRIGQFGSFVAEDFEAGRPFRSDDLLIDPRPAPAEREAYGTYQIRAGAGFPLLRGGKLVAILAVHDMRPHAWTDLEMELIRETAERIWVAVEKVRNEIAVRETAKHQTLRLEFSDSLRAESSPSTVANRAITMLSEHLQLDRCYLASYRLEDDRADITHQVGNDRVPPMPDTIKLSDFPKAFRVVFDRTLVIDDALADQSLSDADRENMSSLGIRALVAPTLRRGAGRPLSAVVAVSARPRHWTDGEIALLEDITERAWAAIERTRAEAALRESEKRFRQFAGASAAGLWIRKAGTLEMEYVSPAMGVIYGVEPEALLGDVQRWAAMVVPEERAAVLAHLEAARIGERAVHEFRIRRVSDGAFRWIRSTDFALEDDGRVDRIGGIAEDITEARELSEHRGVLLAELQHRVRNIMGMIRSMANRTAQEAKSAEDYRTLLEGRLLALARVQAVLTREGNAGGTLRGIIESEVSAQAHRRGQFRLIGDDVVLGPRAVEVLTLVFHELAANALKYGALSVPDGRLTVAWSAVERRGGPWLVLDWVEDNAPMRAPSQRRGFGSELLEGRVPYELGGTGRLSVGPQGAQCHMEFPLHPVESILETDAPHPTTTFGGTLDMTGAPDLTGRKVLVVEDDYYMASDTASALQGAGAEVLGPCPSESSTLRLLEGETPTHAVLDLNLGGGGPRFEIAQMLRQRGVPFIFLTGYDPDVIPPEFRNVMRLEKPVTFRTIVEAVSHL